MGKQVVDVGTTANDGTGDPLRTAMVKINENFDEVYANLTMTNIMTVGNSTVNSSVSNTAGFFTGNSTSFFRANNNQMRVSNTTVNSYLTPDTLLIGENTSITTTLFTTGNTTENVSISKTYLEMANTQANTRIYPNRLVVGANVQVNTIAISAVNSISNTTIDSGVLTIANTTTGRANVEPGKITVGANVIVNTTMITAPSVNVTSNSLGLGSSTVSGNGYTYLPNGLKMNWGWVSANSSDGNAVFTNAFSTAVYSVVATSNTATATYQAGVTAINLGNTNIRTSNDTSTNVRWIAIGV